MTGELGKEQKTPRKGLKVRKERIMKRSALVSSYTEGKTKRDHWNRRRKGGYDDERKKHRDVCTKKVLQDQNRKNRQKKSDKGKGSR